MCSIRHLKMLIREHLNNLAIASGCTSSKAISSSIQELLTALAYGASVVAKNTPALAGGARECAPRSDILKTDN